MSKSNKVLLGAVTILPFFFFIAYFVFIFRFIATTIGNQALDPASFASQFFPMFAFMGIAAVMSIGLLVYYLVHISKNPKFNGSANSSSKVVWILVVIFAGIVGMIAYFFVEVWPEEPSGNTPDILDAN